MGSEMCIRDRYGFIPTVEGPFRWENHPHHQGKFGHQKAIGGRTRMDHRLAFHHDESHHHKPKPKPTPTPTPTGPTEPSSGGGGTASGTISTQPGTEPATDIQNDSEYICAVQIGTPPQQLMLDFVSPIQAKQTHSADSNHRTLDLLTSGYGALSFQQRHKSLVQGESDSSFQEARTDTSQQPHHFQPQELKHIQDQLRLNLEHLIR